MSSVNRREFLRHSMVATGALAAAPVLSRIPSPSLQAPAKVITRTLGRTGIKLPVVSMGVMRADNPALVRAALKAGLVHLDTAHGYQAGKNEEMLGEVLKAYPRDSFVIATKARFEPNTEAFFAQVDLSLQRLQMDHVDILYLHSAPREMTLDPTIIEAMQELKKRGKTRFIGVSTHKNEPEVIEAAIQAKVHDVVLTSFNFKQDHAARMHEAITKAAAAGVGIVAMKTMAGGFLDKERTRPVNCAAALKWVLQHPGVTTTIPGITAFDQLAENAAVNADIALTPEEKEALAFGATEGGLYCNGCEQCVAGCPKRLPIPDMMRAYMYTYGYGSPRMGRELLEEVRVGGHPCEECASCAVRCAKGFNVREKIADVTRLSAVPEEFLA